MSTESVLQVGNRNYELKRIVLGQFLVEKGENPKLPIWVQASFASLQNQAMCFGQLQMTKGRSRWQPEMEEVG